DELLDMFHVVGEVRTLNELLMRRRSYETSMCFLACLMWTITYNVRVGSSVVVDGKGCRSCTIIFNLLQNSRRCEVFDKAGAL
ncbi:hypothetical protein Angca_000454, partial [Angiostrongylus cantonensis]